MSLANALKSTAIAPQLTSQFVGTGGGGGSFLPLAGGVMDPSPNGVIGAHTITGLTTLEGTTAGSGLDTTILTNTGNDILLQTDLADGIVATTGQFQVDASIRAELNANINTRVVVDGSTDEILLKTTSLQLDGITQAVPPKVNVLAYDTATKEVFYQTAASPAPVLSVEGAVGNIDLVGAGTVSIAQTGPSQVTITGAAAPPAPVLSVEGAVGNIDLVGAGTVSIAQTGPSQVTITGAAGAGQSLAQVLLVGNNAGATNIDMNNNDIVNVDTITSQVSVGNPGGDLFLNPVGSVDLNGKTLNMTGGEIHNCDLVHSQNNQPIKIEGKGTGQVQLETDRGNISLITTNGQVAGLTGNIVLATTGANGDIIFNPGGPNRMTIPNTVALPVNIVGSVKPQSITDVLNSTGAPNQVLSAGAGGGSLQWVAAGGGGGGLTYENVPALNGAISPTVDVSVVTGGGTHNLPTAGAVAGQDKTILNQRDSVFNPAMFIGSPANNVVAYTNVSSALVYKVVRKSANEIYVLGSFTGTYEVTPNTNGKGVFLYNETTGAFTALGTGLTLGTGHAYIGGIDAWRDAVNGRLYVIGHFTDAGGVANTQGIAYWDETGLSWNALGTGLQYPNGGRGQCMFYDSTNNRLYIGGDFTTAGGVANTFRIAYWDLGTSAFVALGNGLNAGNQAHQLYYSSAQNRLYIAGAFTSATPAAVGFASTDNAFFCYYDFATSRYVPIGLTASGGTNFNNPIHSFIFDDATGNIFVGGTITVIRNGGTTERLAQYTASTNTWSILGILGKQPSSSGSNNAFRMGRLGNTGYIINVGTEPTQVGGSLNNNNGLAARVYNRTVSFDITNPTDLYLAGGGWNSDSVCLDLDTNTGTDFFYGASGSSPVGGFAITFQSNRPGIVKWNPNNALIVSVSSVSEPSNTRWLPVPGAPAGNVILMANVENFGIKLNYDAVNARWNVGLGRTSLGGFSQAGWWSP